jgi:hypothetical protein
MKLIAIQCDNCKDIVFSRARHDMQFCSCKRVAIDGGPHRANYAIDKLKGVGSYIKITGEKYRKITIDVNLEMQDLIEDYNTDPGELGIIKVEEPPTYFKGIVPDITT